MISNIEPSQKPESICIFTISDFVCVCKTQDTFDFDFFGLGQVFMDLLIFPDLY